MFKSRRKSTASNQEQPGYFDINKPSPTFSTYSSPRDIQQQQRPYSAIGYNSTNNTRLPSLNEALNGPSYMLDSSPASSMRSFNIPSYTSSNGFPQSPASPNSFDPRKASPSSVCSSCAVKLSRILSVRPFSSPEENQMLPRMGRNSYRTLASVVTCEARNRKSFHLVRVKFAVLLVHPNGGQSDFSYRLAVSD